MAIGDSLEADELGQHSLIVAQTALIRASCLPSASTSRLTFLQEEGQISDLEPELIFRCFKCPWGPFTGSAGCFFVIALLESLLLPQSPRLQLKCDSY